MGWLFISLETCVSSSSFDVVETQERKGCFSFLEQESRRGGSRQYASETLLQTALGAIPGDTGGTSPVRESR